MILELWPSQLISDDNWKISVLTGTLLYVSGSCACHSEQILLRLTPGEDLVLTFHRFNGSAHKIKLK